MRHFYPGQLLDSEEQYTLYLTNAWFKQAVDTLAEQFIPAMILGLAVQAQERQDEFVEAVQRLRTMGPLVPPDL